MSKSIKQGIYLGEDTVQLLEDASNFSGESKATLITWCTHAYLLADLRKEMSEGKKMWSLRADIIKRSQV